MSAFFYGVLLQWKLDLRNKSVLITYYVVPLVFFAFMGGIFSSLNPEAKNTLIQSMTVFGVTMGAVLGTPAPLIELFGSEIKKAWKASGIPLWISAINNFMSACIHLLLMSFVIFMIAPIAFGAKSPDHVALYFLALIIFIFVSTAIGTVLGLLVKSAARLAMASQLIFLPSIMLAGIMFPTSMLPSGLEAIGKIFPATWGFKLMTESPFNVAYLIPLGMIILVSIFISLYRLVRISAE